MIFVPPLVRDFSPQHDHVVVQEDLAIIRDKIATVNAADCPFASWFMPTWSKTISLISNPPHLEPCDSGWAIDPVSSSLTLILYHVFFFFSPFLLTALFQKPSIVELIFFLYVALIYFGTITAGMNIWKCVQMTEILVFLCWYSPKTRKIEPGVWCWSHILLTPFLSPAPHMNTIRSHTWTQK